MESEIKEQPRCSLGNVKQVSLEEGTYIHIRCQAHSEGHVLFEPKIY